MKHIQALLVSAICGVIFSFGANAFAQSTPGYATIVRIQGEARYSRDSKTWLPLTVGQTLDAGCVIQTAADSTVDLVLGQRISHHIDSTVKPIGPAPDAPVRDLVNYKATAEQNVIKMQPGTVLAIDKLTVADTGIDAVSDTELDLRQGTIFGNVKKLSAASQYFVKIPNGMAAVRGTTFIISASGAITVVQGSMVLSTVVNGQPVTVVLGPGDQYDPATGQTTHLTPQEFAAAERTAIETVTVIEGIISFANDTTLIYVSPVQGKQAHGPP